MASCFFDSLQYDLHTSSDMCLVLSFYVVYLYVPLPDASLKRDSSDCHATVAACIL